MICRAPLIAAALIVVHPAAAHQDPPRLRGSVLAPDERPVTSGTVTIRALGSEVIASIGPDGAFAIEPPLLGPLDLQISSPGFARHRLRVTVPPSRRLVLPPVRLTPPTYVRVRLLSPSGEPLSGVPIIRSSYELNGDPIYERDGELHPPSNDADGATIIGPVPRGIAILGVDTQPLARKRLKDLRVTGEDPLVDAGSVTVFAGATLRVQLVDRTGARVSRHPVSVDDGQALSPLRVPPTRTDEEGVAVFDRLGPGAYRLRVSGPQPCPYQLPTIERPVRVSAQFVNVRIVLDVVKLAVRVTGAALASGATITPDSQPLAMPTWLREPNPFLAMRERLGALADAACPGDADRSGRFLFVNVPVGQARIDLRVGGSTWTRKITVPPQGGELTLQVPSGVAPLRTVGADDGAPVAGAVVTWQARGIRIEAQTQATGEALLQGVPNAAARVIVRSPGYLPLETTMAGPPAVLHEIVLERRPNPSLVVSVANDIGKPVAAAVVQIVPDDALEVTRVAATDAAGVVEFVDLPPGAVRVTVSANGFMPATQTAVVGAKAARSAIALTRSLTRRK